MFEFRNEVVYRDGFKFHAKLENGKYIYKAKDKKEIDILESYGFKNKVIKTVKKDKNESTKKDS